jgi:beta-mannanase
LWYIWKNMLLSNKETIFAGSKTNFPASIYYASVPLCDTFLYSHSISNVITYIMCFMNEQTIRFWWALTVTVTTFS